MKNAKAGPISGFTLIELLVVVLIIGILASVALPQYEKAVEKSRAVEALSFFNTLEKAEKSYQLATGRYTRNLDRLDIEISGLYNIGYGLNEWSTSKFSYWTEAESFGGGQRFKAGAAPKSQKYKLYFELETDGSYEIWCGPYTTAAKNWPSRPAADQIPSICKAIASSPDGVIARQ